MLGFIRNWFRKELEYSAGGIATESDTPVLKPDGFMPFVYKGKEYKIWGGPYRNKPNDIVGVS